MPLLLLSYGVEQYRVLRNRYSWLEAVLPPVTGDLIYMQPAVSSLCALHTVYTDTAAQEEIGYRAPITTIEGFVLAVLDWNTKIEEKEKLKKSTKP